MNGSTTIVILGGALGDTVLTLPMIHALPQRWAGGVEVIARRAHLPILHASTLPLEVNTYEQPPWDRLFSASSVKLQASVAERLRQADGVINLLDGGEGPLTTNLRRLAGDRLIVVPSRPPSSWHRSVAAYLATTLRLNRVDYTRPLLHVPIAARNAARTTLRQRGAGEGPIVMIHPGSGGVRKCWPVVRFQVLADALGEAGFAPVFLIGPDEIEQFGTTFVFQLQRVAPVLGPLPLAEALPMVAAAHAYVGNDAGMTHVAAQLAVPTVAIFGATDPAVWKPLGPRVQVVGASSLMDVSVESVMAAIQTVVPSDIALRETEPPS